MNMEEEIHSNNYWPAFVDLMVVLFFIALALAGYTVTEYAGKEKALRQDSTNLANEQKKLAGSMEFQRALQEQMQIRKSLQEQFRINMIRIDTSEKKKIKLEGDFYFEHDSFNLRPGAVNAIILIGNSIRNVLETDRNFEKYTFIVEGHTDSIGTEEYNMELSFKRAASITRIWATHCGLKLPTYEILPAGFGESVPAQDKKKQNSNASNRRIELAIIPKLNEFTRLIQTDENP